MNTATEPVLLNGSAATIAAAATPLLIIAGVNASDAGRIGSYAGAALALIFTLWHLFSARSKVTPLATLEAAAGAITQTLDEVVPIAAPGADAPVPESEQQPPEGAELPASTP